MKTTLVLSIIAALCLPAPTIQATSETTRLSTHADGVCNQKINAPAMLIGAGTIRAKSGNNYTLRSDDGSTYQAQSTSSYEIGDYVYHGEPSYGWVEILGHAD